MGFYDEISKYYDYIFPVGQSQLQFISDAADEAAGSTERNNSAAILDVACGSGGYSVELSRKGYDVTAVDLEEKMIEMARQKAADAGVSIKALTCDMTKLTGNLKGPYDCIFCIGNSIVHLGSIDEITAALTEMRQLLSHKGTLVLQIINYDRVMKYGINELPAIKNDEVGLEFIRKYEHNNNKGVINFNTTLSIGKGRIEETFKNSIELLPLTSDKMEQALKQAGYSDITFFGDFNGITFSDDSYMLVVRAKQ